MRNYAGELFELQLPWCTVIPWANSSLWMCAVVATNPYAGLGRFSA